MGRLTHHTGPGRTYFITTKAWESKFLFQAEETAKIIVAKILEYRGRGNYPLHDFVLILNHLLLILTPAVMVSLEKAMQLIKGGSSHEIHAIRRGKMPVWQSGFHESRVTSWVDYQAKRDYVRFIPVTAKLVERPELWPYGSASRNFLLDPIPQGLKPVTIPSVDVGPKNPTPAAKIEAESGVQERAILQGLKPVVSQSVNVGAKAPTPGAVTKGTIG